MKEIEILVELHSSLEDADDLGYFLEVEYCTSDDVDVLKVKEEIWEFIKSMNLNVSSEVTMGKPEILLRKVGYIDK